MVKLGVRNLVDEGLREYVVSEGPHNRNTYLWLVLVSGLKCRIRNFSVKRLFFFGFFSFLKRARQPLPSFTIRHRNDPSSTAAS